MRGRGIPAPSNSHLLDNPLNLASADHLAILADRIQRLGIRLVIVDGLARYMVGVDENVAGQSAPVLTGVRYLANQSGAAFLFGHHLNKAQGFVRSLIEKIRGSIDIAGSVDVACVLRAKVECTGTPRHAPAGPPPVEVLLLWTDRNGLGGPVS